MRTWQHSPLCAVQLTDDGFIEVHSGQDKDRPQRLQCGRIVYDKPRSFPKGLRILVRKAFDDLWHNAKKARNDLMVHYRPPKRKSIWA
jgi:hypothetical protein